VGTALALYLKKDRPAGPSRRVFLCTKAPHRGFHPSSVSAIVERAALHPFLEHLRAVEAAPPRRLSEPSPTEVLVGDYVDHPPNDRGLCARFGVCQERTRTAAARAQRS